MEAVRQSWTDDRLDEFGKRVDERFDRVDRRFDEVDRRFDRVDKRFDRMEAGFNRIDARLDGMQRATAHGVIALSAAMVAGFAGVMGLIATQL